MCIKNNVSDTLCCKKHVRFPDMEGSCAGSDYWDSDSDYESDAIDIRRRKSSESSTGSASMGPLNRFYYTYSRDEYERAGPEIRIKNVGKIITELDRFKMYEMRVHRKSLCNTLTYSDAAARREQYATNKFVFLALQNELLAKYENVITVDTCLDVCQIDATRGCLVVV
jgi:hypothetical protein